MSKDDSTWLNIAYVLFAIVIAFVGFKAISALGIQYGWVERYDEWFPTATNVGGILIGAGVAFWLQSDPGRREFHLSAISEIRKVTWPSLENTKKMTWIVAIVVAIFSVILAVFDIAWSKVLQIILP